MTVALGVAVVIASLAGSSALAQQSSPVPNTSRGLLITYADGRMHTKPVRNVGVMWTADFPRVPGATPTYEGLALSVLDVRYVVDGTDVVVEVALSYGSAGKNQVKMPAVRLSPTAKVEIKELRDYGVQPISLSIVSIPDTPTTAPETVSPSPMLDIRAVQWGPNASSYRVVVTNRSNVPLMWMHYRAYRDGKTITALPRGRLSTPLVQANARYAFDLNIGTTGFVPGSEPYAWSPVDRIEITSLMWQDGTVEGDLDKARSQARLEERRAAELRTVIQVLGAGTAQSAATLRARIASLKISSPDLDEAMKLAGSELESLATNGRSFDGLSYGVWLARMIRAHQEWLDRIVMPKVDR